MYMFTCLYRCCFGLETRMIIKISTHPFFFFKITDSKKTEIFKTANSQYQCPLRQSILITLAPIPEILRKSFENWRFGKSQFFESAILSPKQHLRKHMQHSVGTYILTWFYDLKSRFLLQKSRTCAENFDKQY
jgi:hypothetical protein